ncbi:MAG: chromosome partitioning protein [uncultured bacterium]|nr:MAG: chromosome partitioning protein [uncultured bacterium]
MEIISFVNQKGGVGKSCNCLNIGAYLALKGKNVLIIDNDPQGSITSGLGLSDSADDKSLYDVYTGKKNLDDVILDIPGTKYFVAPNSIYSCELEATLPPRMGFTILKHQIEKLKKTFDYILIDNPPSLGALLTNGIASANKLYLCLVPEPESIKGIQKLQDTINKINENFYLDRQIDGVIFSLWDERRKLSKDIFEAVIKMYGDKVFKTKIRRNVQLAETPLNKTDIFRYDKNSIGSIDYEKLGKEILKHE